MISFGVKFSQVPASILHRTNSICASFIWKSKSHKMPWEDVCKTKEEGRIGIRRLSDVAKAINIKFSVEFFKRRKSLGSMDKNKYCRSGDFWTIQVDNNASHTWKTLLKTRTLCKGLTDKNISDGENTNMWFEPRLNGVSLIDLLGWHHLSMVGGPNNSLLPPK